MLDDRRRMIPDELGAGLADPVVAKLPLDAVRGWERPGFLVICPLR